MDRFGSDGLGCVQGFIASHGRVRQIINADDGLAHNIGADGVT